MRGGVTQETSARVTWSRAFDTRQAGDPPGRVRTRGHVLEHRDATASPAQVVDTVAIAPAPDVDSARGKVAVLRLAHERSEVATFQVADTDGHAELAACSNATA